MMMVFEQIGNINNFDSWHERRLVYKQKKKDSNFKNQSEYSKLNLESKQKYSFDFITINRASFFQWTLKLKINFLNVLLALNKVIICEAPHFLQTLT